MDHGLVAAILNDYYNMAKMNVFVLIYVEKMLHISHEEEISNLDCLDNNLVWNIEPWMGMLEQVGLYTKESDIDALINALNDITKIKKNLFKSIN